MRIHKHQRSVVAAVAAVGALALAGCGPSVGGSSGSATEADVVDWANVEPATSISFLTNHPGGSIDLEEKIIADFEAETGIKVEMITGGSYPEVYQKFSTAQTGGNVPEVVVLADVTWFSAYLADTIIPVDDIMKAADIDTATYVQGFYDDYLYGDQHWAIPYARSTPIYYYNKDHYEKAGLPDEAPATWADVKENSEKVQDAVGGVAFGFPDEANYPAYYLANLLWGDGGDWSDKWDMEPMTSSETVGAMQFAQDAVTDGWGLVVESVDTAFSAGAVSQFVGTTGVLKSTIDNAGFEVGIAPLPKGTTDTDKIVPTGGSGMGIAKKITPEQQLAAAMFVGYMTNVENAAYFSGGTGYMPVQKDADMTEVYAEYPEFKTAVDQLDRTRPQAYARVLLPGGDLALASGINTILTTGADVEGTLQSTKEELQNLYDRDVKDRLEELGGDN